MSDTAQLDRIEKQLASLFDHINQPAKRWLTVANAASYCDLSEESIRKMLDAGDLTAHRPGAVRGRILIDRKQLDAVISSSTSRPRVGRGLGR